jgi:cephalosporin-C deacetylase-like acetyl esterase
MFPRNKILAVTALLLSINSPLRSQQPKAPLTPTVALPDASHDAEAAPSASSVEDWDKLALQASDLHPGPPLFGQADQLPEFTRELVRVQWRRGDPIDLYIVRPVGVAKPPVIVYLYGYPGEAVRFLNDALCKTVTKNGYAAIGFSPRLTGQRYHEVPMNEWFVSDLQRSLVGTTHDVQMVLNYLNGRGDFDMDRVGVFGEGSGGTVALLAASVDPRIRAVDLLNPWGDWPDWLQSSRLVPDAERPEYLTTAFLKSIAPLDPVILLPKLSHPPLRLQQNLWDVAKTPTTAGQRIAAALPRNAQLAQYKNEQEYVEKVGSNGKMLEWLYLHLLPSPSSGLNH